MTESCWRLSSMSFQSLFTYIFFRTCNTNSSVNSKKSSAVFVNGTEKTRKRTINQLVYKKRSCCAQRLERLALDLFPLIGDLQKTPKSIRMYHYFPVVTSWSCKSLINTPELSVEKSWCNTFKAWGKWTCNYSDDLNMTFSQMKVTAVTHG